jgi:hypothetical protein
LVSSNDSLRSKFFRLERFIKIATERFFDPTRFPNLHGIERYAMIDFSIREAERSPGMRHLNSLSALAPAIFGVYLAIRSAKLQRDSVPSTRAILHSDIK